MPSESLVLFSGGWDSVFCAVKAKAKERRHPLLCFYNYGQSYLEQETVATAAISTELQLTLWSKRLPSIKDVGGGKFDNRNEVLLAQAVHDHRPRRVYFGSRNLFRWMDRYGDSNRQWANEMEKKYGVQIVTPATALPKFLIRRAVVKAGIPARMVFSTEGLKP